jgi:hypothetical protein
MCLLPTVLCYRLQCSEYDRVLFASTDDICEREREREKAHAETLQNGACSVAAAAAVAAC